MISAKEMREKMYKLNEENTITLKDIEEEILNNLKEGYVNIAGKLNPDIINELELNGYKIMRHNCLTTIIWK